MGNSGSSGGSTSPLTTKGDVWGYSTVNARIPAGPDGQVMTADSTQTLGLKWAASTGALPWIASGDTLYLTSTLGSNLALAATPSLNQQGSFGDPAGNINDNNVTTHAYVNNAVGAGFQYDFGSPTAFNLVQMVWQNSCNTWKIQGSSDNSTWVDLTGTVTSGGSGTDQINFATATYRYMRLYALGGFQAPGVGCQELRVYNALLTPVRLAIGSANQVLTVSGGLPVWAAAAGVTFPLTAAGDETFQPGGVANNVLTLHNNASAVNLVTLTGTATGSDPTLVVSGDANRGLVINPAGTGTITVGGKSDTGVPLTVAGNSATQTGDLLDVYQNSGGNPLFKFTTVSAGANGLTFAASAASNAVTMTVAGTGTNVPLTINAKGTGALNLYTGNSSGGQIVVGSSAAGGAILLKSAQTIGLFPGTSTWYTVAASGVASGTNGVQVTQAVSGSAPSIAPLAQSDTNVDLTIAGVGTGVINYGYASAAISGATPATLATGTGGATGPATAAQNAWLAVKINGTTSYIPFWR